VSFRENQTFNTMFYLCVSKMQHSDRTSELSIIIIGYIVVAANAVTAKAENDRAAVIALLNIAGAGRKSFTGAEANRPPRVEDLSQWRAQCGPDSVGLRTPSRTGTVVRRTLCTPPRSTPSTLRNAENWRI
jgi:hypothetical protein